MAEDGKDEQYLAAAAEATAAEAASRISAGNLMGALQLLVADPPVNVKNANVKQAYADVVLRIFPAVNDVNAAVESLSPAELDNVLKYVYVGLSSGQNALALLKWHATIIEKAGPGAIMRVLTEKRVCDNKVIA
eukprot:TRINITY_DN873_c0_g1_i1.p1 TRINITY_DN873_c0_g1~~TRINITY_DN873_c0_g1_i1.p1  ORF type:complete len:134 (+),score=41.12 TRINITY_DN873_c0_g1_i1:169-570(+)